MFGLKVLHSPLHNSGDRKIKKGCIAATLLYLTKYGSSGPQAQLAVVRWLAAVLLETPAHPTGLFSPRKADSKKPDQWPGFSLFGSACWARTSDPMINSHLLYQLS